MASPVWVPPSLRCSGFPGFTQAGNNPAHTGRWDLERLHPAPAAQGCQQPLPDGASQSSVNTQGQAWGHTRTGLGTHPSYPALGSLGTAITASICHPDTPWAAAGPAQGCSISTLPDASQAGNSALVLFLSLALQNSPVWCKGITHPQGPDSV